MQAEEREEFTRQVSILCAAFGVPIGDRDEALWRAFSRLSLVEFSRIVDAAVAPDCEYERFPTTKQLWVLRKQGRARFASDLPKGAQVALVEYALRNLPISDRQKSVAWNWIARETGEILGVIVPQDPNDPVKHPAQRVMFADVEWRQYLEGSAPSTQRMDWLSGSLKALSEQKGIPRG